MHRTAVTRIASAIADSLAYPHARLSDASFFKLDSAGYDYYGDCFVRPEFPFRGI
jgi:hypothetical protein